METIHIKLSQIDFDDPSYSVWAWSDYGHIRESIKLIGLQTPPKIVRSRKTKYAIVSGHKRLRALRNLKRKVLECLLLDSPKDSTQLFVNTLWENLSFREYNSVEKSLILKRLDGFTSCGYHIEKLHERLGLSKRNTTKIKALLMLPAEIQKLISCGQISEGPALQLTELQKSEALAVARVFAAVPMGRNSQREILAILSELSRIQSRPIRKILGRSEIEKPMRSKDLTFSQKEMAIRKAAKTMRHPNKSLFEKEFVEMKGKTKLDPCLRMLNRSPFEDDSLKFEVAVKSREDLVRVVECLESMAKDPKTGKLISSSQGLPYRS